MHRLIITAMLAFAAIAASAQTVIEGTVADAQGKHVEAYVSVAPKGTGNILVFADTDAKGHYRLEFTTEADSVTVSASGLAIGSHTKQVANRSQRLDFCVKEQAMQLKEVTVRAQKIRQNGDTLSYLVGAYQQQGDRVIGDVLKHMPGIEVADNGGIKYNGKTIKKLYVEEMDLLQGRYGLATNNINASDVATVQVLEHHQPVKMLQDKELSDDVAINLKLKNSAKGTVAINTMLGGGAQQAGGWHIGKRPLTDSQAAIGQSPLWTAEVVGMYFAKRRQNMTLYKGNNTGDDVSKELTQHYSSVNSVSLYPFCPTGALMPNGSGLPQKRTFDNHSQILTMNHLEKPNKDTELGLNIAYYNDRIRREGSSVGDQFVSDDSRLLASERTGAEPANYGNNRVRQHFDRPQLSVSNTFNTIRNIGKNTFDLHFSAGYAHRPNTLTVGVDSLLQGTSTAYTQDVNSHHIAASFNTSYAIRVGQRFRFSYGVSATANLHGIVTDLDGFTPPAEHAQLDNDLWYNTYCVALAQTYKYETPNFYIGLGVPLELYTQTLDDKIRNDQHGYTHLLFFPSLSANWSISRDLWLNAGANYSKTVGDPGGIYSGYIMSNYRAFQRSYVEQLRPRNAMVSVRFKLL